MLNYNKFKQVVKTRLLSYMGDEYKNYYVKISTIRKNNVTYDCINVLPKNKSKIISQNVYLEDVYDRYKSNDDLNETLFTLANAIRTIADSCPKNISINDVLPTKEDIILMVINASTNKKLLEQVPHEEFLDLAIVCKCIRNIKGIGMSGVLINNDILKSLGLDENDLFELARENTERIMPNTLNCMEDIINQTVKELNLDENLELKHPYMFVASNMLKNSGANAILNNKLLSECRTAFGKDFFILPSSIHEIILIPDLGQDVDELRVMVKEVNDTTVDIEDRLSYSVYKYIQEIGNIVIA